MDDRVEETLEPEGGTSCGENPKDTLANLKSALEQFAADAEFEDGSEDRIELSRKSAIGLLECLYESLRFEFGRPIEGDPTIVLEHPALTLLLDLKDAIEDLDKPKHHPALQPGSGKGGRMLPKRLERERYEIALLLEVYRRSDGKAPHAKNKNKPLNEAASELARLLKRGRLWPGVTPSDLIHTRKWALRNGFLTTKQARTKRIITPPR